MPYLAGFVTPQDYGALGNGTNDDTAAINSALAAVFANGGGMVLLPSGAYLVSGTISIPPYTFLVGQSAITLNLFTTPPPTLSRIVASASWAPSSSAGVISILSKTPGGWSTNTAACGLRSVMIDGSLNANTNLNCINMVGPVYDVHLDDVFLWKAPNDGITASGQSESGIAPTFPYHHRYTRVSAVSNGLTGFNLVNFTDSTFANCLAFGNAANGWSLQNNSNSELAQCRSEWNLARGFDITGSAGSVVLNACTTDQNTSEGLRIHAATGQSVQGGGIVVSGGKFHADGNGGTNNNGIKITGSTVPVMITGVNVESGQDVNNSNYYPATAIEIDTSSNITVAGSMLQGITTAWSDGGGNANLTRSGCIAATGNPNTQSFTQLIDLPYAPNPTPADQSLIAWTYDPVTAGGNASATSGTLFLVKIYIRQAATISKGLVQIVGAAVTPTLNQNFLGLYDSGGTLRASTTAGTIDTATSTANTLLTGTFTTPYAAPAGFYWLAILFNAATAATVMRGGTSGSPSFADMGNTAATDRFAANGTGLTSLPATITPSSNTHSGAAAFWAGAQ